MIAKYNLYRYIDASFPILYLNTFEEENAEELIYSVADRKKIIVWGMADGISTYRMRNGEREYLQISQEATIDQFFAEYCCNPEVEFNNCLVIFKDAHTILEESINIAYLKKLASLINQGLECTIILISPVLKIPIELEKHITIIEQQPLAYEEIQAVVSNFATEAEQILAPTLIEEMSCAFKGLTEYEIRNILALAYADDGSLTKGDLKLIFEQKKQTVLKSGILEMVAVREQIDDIGGLENLKEWLERKSKVICNLRKAEEFGVDIPKGVLIAGVPGCGKSLCAKAASSVFDIPLLRLDVGKLMGKYLGESEANMRRAISLAEAISPCVLWIDELEKAFAGIGSEGGHEVTSRLFGTFLTWMQEKTSSAFVMATANDITKLPPELLRKGRFDEIFYVGLPSDRERKKIFEIHIIKRRKQDFESIDVDKLVAQTKGYSGADIEGVVKAGIEIAFTSEKSAVATEDFIAAIRDTHSLSEIMKEPLEKMSKEYENRKFKNASK